MAEGLFSLISEERLTSVLSTLQAYTQMQILIIDSNGNLLKAFGQQPTYCSRLKECVFLHNECFQFQKNAGIRAKDIGEAYLFSCHANMNNIAFPLIHQKELLGTVIIGPYLMDQPDSTIVSSLCDKYTLGPEMALDLYDDLNSIPVISPARANHLRMLVEHLLSPLLESERAIMLHTQKKMYQQAKLNETIQQYKEQQSTPSSNYFYTKETELLTKARSGNIQAAKDLLNELIGHLLFVEGSNMDIIRSRAIELTTLLSRISIESGAKVESIYSLNRQYLEMISREQNLDNLCLLMEDIVETFISAELIRNDKGNTYIRNALHYISNNFTQKLSLTAVANQVGLSPNHFSGLFHETVGISFREYLYQFRVEESKRLLLSTDYSLSEIAIAMGFSDQSHYCKVFKKVVGISPRKYRG